VINYDLLSMNKASTQSRVAALQSPIGKTQDIVALSATAGKHSSSKPQRHVVLFFVFEGKLARETKHDANERRQGVNSLRSGRGRWRSTTSARRVLRSRTGISRAARLRAGCPHEPPRRPRAFPAITPICAFSAIESRLTDKFERSCASEVRGRLCSQLFEV
jgi:hypothetical protein